MTFSPVSLAAGLALGSAMGGSSTNQLPRKVLVIIPNENYKFGETLKRWFKDAKEIEENREGDGPIHMRVKMQKEKINYFVQHVEELHFTYLEFMIKDSDGNWEITTVNLLKTLLSDLSDYQVKYEVWL